MIGFESLGESIPFKSVLRNDIYGIELEILLLQQEILVLGVDIHEHFAKLSHLMYGGRRVIDKASALSCRCQFAPNDAVFWVEVNVIILKPFADAILREVEM